jgi:hypothetical protein
VRLVDRLVAAGLAERRPGRDGRSLSIVLTATGRALSDQVTASRAAAIESAIEGLDGDDRRALVELVDALVTTVTVQRLDQRRRGDEPAGWLCRLCDAVSCGRPDGECPAANAARAGSTGASAAAGVSGRERRGRG